MAEFTIMESSRPEREDWSRWKPHTPEAVLVVIDKGRCMLLDHCGRANEFESEQGELAYQIEECEWNLSDGLWIVPGAPNYSKDYYGEVEGGWDQEGSPRRLTDEEWRCHKDEEYVWGVEWLQPEPEDTTCRAPIPEVGTCEGELCRWQFFVDIVDCYWMPSKD